MEPLVLQRQEQEWQPELLALPEQLPPALPEQPVPHERRLPEQQRQEQPRGPLEQPALQPAWPQQHCPPEVHRRWRDAGLRLPDQPEDGRQWQGQEASP